MSGIVLYGGPPVPPAFPIGDPIPTHPQIPAPVVNPSWPFSTGPLGNAGDPISKASAEVALANYHVMCALAEVLVGASDERREKILKAVRRANRSLAALTAALADLK